MIFNTIFAGLRCPSSRANQANWDWLSLKLRPGGAVYFTLLLLFAGPLAESGAQEKSVLYFNSYNLGYEWSDRVMNGLYEVFESDRDVVVYTELLEGKRFPGLAYSEPYLEGLRSKYGSISFDAIICSDNYSLDWLLAQRDALELQGIPIVFCGISNPEDYSRVENLYGVVEKRDFEAVVEAIHQLDSEVDELHLLLDNTPTGFEYRSVFEALQDEWAGRIQFVYHNENSLEGIEADFRSLGENSALFYTVLTMGEGGVAIDSVKFLPKLLSVCPVPIYGDLLADMSEGLVGGPTNNAQIQGKMSASLALSLLNKEQVSPRVVNPEVEWLFDYVALERFGLDPENVPTGAEVLNRPIPVFQLYKVEIIGTAIVLVLLAFTVALLMIILYRERQHEKALRIEKEKAEESDRLKSAFLANISHEIRTPLNAVIGFSSVLDEDDSLNEEQRDNVDIIVGSGYELRDTISNIVEYSCVESGSVSIIPSTFELGALLDRLYSHDLLATKDHQRIQITNHLEAGCTMYSDEELLLQCLSQLVHNGLKFSGADPVELSVRAHPEGLEFCVSDTGVGISESELETIYKPFQKGNMSGTRFYSGPGLGLSLVSSFIGYLKGSISIQTKKGLGTKVFLRVPARMN